MSPRVNVPKPLTPEVEQHLLTSSPEERVRTFLQLASVPVLATSFGAQSAAAIHLVTRVRPDMPVVFVRQPNIDLGTELYMLRLTELFNLQLHTIHVREGDNKLDAFNRVLKVMGSTGWISGIRQTQNWTRASANVIEKQDGRLKLHPIFDWTNEQVAEYYAKFDLPVHPTFKDNYSGNGIPRSPGAGDATSNLSNIEFPRECGLHRRFAEVEREDRERGQ